MTIFSIDFPSSLMTLSYVNLTLFRSINKHSFQIHWWGKKSQLFEHTNLGCSYCECQVITTGLFPTQSDCYLLFIMLVSFLPRIFRKKKRTHRSLSSLLDPRASKSWLHGSIFGEVDSLPSEDLWLDGIRSLGRYHFDESDDLCFFIP